jgi:type I restriction enzyme S subunit
MREPLPLVKLGDLADLRMGGTPSRVEPSFWADGQSGHAWAAISDLKGKYLDSTTETITAAGIHAARLQIVPPGTPIMSFKLTLGKASIPRIPVYTNEAIVSLTPYADRSDAAWLYHAVPAVAKVSVTETAVKGQTLNLAELGELNIPTPSLAEQRRIAEILDTLDGQIRASAANIAKLSDVRDGLIRETMASGLELLRGAEASELYRAEQLSRGDWSLVALGSLLSGIDAGNSPDLEDTPAGPGQWGVLKVSAVGNGVFRPRENKVAPDRAMHYAAICVQPGDLLMTRSNTPQLVGLSCIVQDTPPHLMLCDKTLRLRVTHPYATTDYVQIILGVDEVRRQIEIAATGTSGSMKNISQHAIRRLMIPVGNAADTMRVIEVQTSMKDRIETERNELKRLQLLKQGLMDDLLTGRVRVTDGGMEHMGAG